MSNRQKVVRIAALVATIVGLAVVAISRYYKKPIYVRGAVIKEDNDPMKESPITDVEVSVANGLAETSTKSNFAGFYSIRLNQGVSQDQILTLKFRHPDYVPLDLTEPFEEKLSIIHLVPVHKDIEKPANRPIIPVTNVLIRYSTQATVEQNVGTEAKTFQIPNIGNISCNHGHVCSPNGKWKAGTATQSLDAGEGNEFRNARASCIAGPCPFSKIDVDGFSKGGRHIQATVRNWSDTTTFLLQAEVYHTQIENIVRLAYPVILGTSLNFTLPPAAEGPSVEAEINNEEIIFPLGPKPTMPWANCNVSVDKNNASFYRCDLKNGYKFQESK